jgi:2-keto-4-pentenoate hydratase/2-oxohepta-3-ene-1,7-dioic acid hydratase in catechol pathway
MRLVAFREGDAERVGVLVGDAGAPVVGTVVDLLKALPVDAPERAHFVSMAALVRGGDGAVRLAREVAASAPAAARLPLASVRLAPPLRAATILCAGSNYRDHNKEKANTPISGKEPEFFVKTADCVIGPEDTILHDLAFSRKLDGETELAIVIGRPGRHIPVARALDHVFGYTIVNDVTARDRQVRRTPQGFTWYELGRSKCFATFAPTGPCIVTADEIPDPQALRLRTRVNGELRQSASTGSMIFSCAELIHFFSANFTLQPGMVIITGTPGGTAWSTDAELGGKWIGGDGDEPLVPAKGYLQPGDVIECELERIGVLRNVVGTA